MARDINKSTMILASLMAAAMTGSLDAIPRFRSAHEIKQLTPEQEALQKELQARCELERIDKAEAKRKRKLAKKALTK